MTDTKEFNYDLIVIGAGPGGYEAAFEAVKFGMKTAIVERDLVGGTCLNRGCIPTKAIMRSAELFNEMKDASSIGVNASGLTADLDKILERKNEVLTTLRDGILSMIKKNKIDLLEGTGKVTGAHSVDVSGSEYTSKFILVATGSHPFVPPIPGAALEGVITSDDLLELGGTPVDDLVIIGGGAIGIEFATIYNDLGTHVTVIEALDRLIPTMDKELGRSLKMNLTKKGVEVHTAAKVDKIDSADGRLTCTFTEKDKQETIAADKILISTGRRANTEGLFADEFAELLDRGRLTVDANGQTACPSIYGIGDAIGGILLAHVATAEGRNAVAHMNGAAPGVDMKAVPGCIYTNPEIAAVGMSQDDAKEAGVAVITKKFPMSANGKTVIEDLDRGYIKLVAREEDHVLIGAQLMCGRATDLVGELSIAISNELTLEDIGKTIHPHPTFTEAVMDTARL